MIKLICSDMDGTLVGNKHEISKKNVNAIKGAQELGVEFLVVTGRSYNDTVRQLEDARICCKSLVMNGAELRDSDGEILWSNYLEKDAIRKVIKILNDHELYSELYTNKGNYTVCPPPLRKHSFAVRATHFFPNIDYADAYQKAEQNEIYSNVSYIENLDEFLDDDLLVGKIICFDDNVDLLDDLREKLPLELGLEVSGSFLINLEVTNSGAQKGASIKRYSRNHGISLSEIMTIGDGLNDLTMMDSDFGVTVAMGNGIEELKQKAKFVTETNTDDGVAKAIEKYLGGINKK